MLMRGPRTSPNEWIGICSHLPSRGLQPLFEKSASSNVSRDSTSAQAMPVSCTGRTWHYDSTYLRTLLFPYVLPRLQTAGLIDVTSYRQLHSRPSQEVPPSTRLIEVCLTG